GDATAYVINHLLGRISERQFIDTWIIEVSGKAGKAGAAIFFVGPKARVPFAPVQDNGRDGSDRLNIINDRWTAIEALDGGERWLKPRQSALAFEGLHQRGLFAYFVGAGTGVGQNVELTLAAEDVLAKKALRISVTYRLLYDLEQIAIFATKIYEAELGPDRQSGDQCAFDNCVGVVFSQQPVLAGSRLALVAVDEDVLR